MFMVQKGFIMDADRALSNLIWNDIKTESTAKNKISSQDQISFSSPKANPGTRKLSIFLYSITEEIAARNMSPSANGSEKSTSHTSFVLRYLVTPFTGNDKDDHALLEKIICTVLATPLIAITDKTSNVELKVKIDSLSLDDLTKLWIALGAPLRLSVNLSISFSEPLYDSPTQRMSATIAPQILLYQVVHKTFTEQSMVG